MHIGIIDHLCVVEITSNKFSQMQCIHYSLGLSLSEEWYKSGCCSSTA